MRTLGLTVFAACLSSLLTGAMAPVAKAVEKQPAPAPYLASARISERDACAVLKIEFNSKMRYRAHAPLSGRGDEITISLEPVAQQAEAAVGILKQETLRAPANDRMGVHAIELLNGANGTTLSLYMKRSVAFSIASGTDEKSLYVAVAGPDPKPACVPLAPQDTVSADAAPGAREAEAEKAIDAVVAAVREAVAKGENDRALGLIADPRLKDHRRHDAEVRELTGVIHEHAGRLPQARRIYEEYLAAYPKGPGADRVHARLATLIAGPRPAPTQAGIATADATPQPVRSDVPISDGAISAPQGIVIDSGPGVGTPESTGSNQTLTQSGSAGVYYNRNQGGRDFFVPPRLQLGWDKENIYQVYQNSVLATFDYRARYENPDFAGKVQVAASRDNDYIDGRADLSAVSSAFIEGTDKSSGFTGRVGRQTRYTSGVLGRFDGALASYGASEWVTVNAVAGAPVLRSRDRPFLYDSHFYGLSTDLTHWKDHFETSWFIVEQRTDGLLDRQGIGAEFRLMGDQTSLLGTADYDVHFSELNYAILSGSYGFHNASVVGFSLDYRRSPLIFTSNALQGQTTATLSELLRKYSAGEIERYALDRTAQAWTANFNYLVPFGEHLSWLTDVTMTRMSGTEASAEVPAMDAPGTEIYAYSQLTAVDLWATGDLYSAAIRYGETQRAARYALEFAARYPMTQEFKIGPVVRLGFVDATDGIEDETHVMPALRLTYAVRKDTDLELEIGNKWIERDTQHGPEKETELMIMTGVLYNFFTD